MQFNDLTQGQRFQDDLRQAAGYAPITRSELENAYSRYKDVGVKMGRVGGKSDAALYQMATDDVLNWWRAQKSAEAEESRRRSSSGRNPNNAAPLPSRGGQPSYGAGGNRGGATGRRGSSGMLPDTSTRAVGGTTTPPVSIVYVQNMLSRYGLRNASVPSYARRSQRDFDAWLQRTLRFREQFTPYSPAPTNRTPAIR